MIGSVGACSRARMRRITSSPSISGIIMSMRTDFDVGVGLEKRQAIHAALGIDHVGAVALAGSWSPRRCYAHRRRRPASFLPLSTASVAAQLFPRSRRCAGQILSRCGAVAARSRRGRARASSRPSPGWSAPAAQLRFLLAGEIAARVDDDRQLAQILPGPSASAEARTRSCRAARDRGRCSRRSRAPSACRAAAAAVGADDHRPRALRGARPGRHARVHRPRRCSRRRTGVAAERRQDTASARAPAAPSRPRRRNEAAATAHPLPLRFVAQDGAPERGASPGRASTGRAPPAPSMSAS